MNGLWMYVSNQIRPIQIRVGNDLKVVEPQDAAKRRGSSLHGALEV